MRKSLGDRLLAAIGMPFAWIYRVIFESKPAQRFFGTAVMRFVFGLISVVWQALRRLVRRVRKLLGDREVIPWILTWVMCVVLAVVIMLPLVYLKLFAGAFVAIAFTLIAFRSPLVGLLSWLVVSPFLNILIRFKFLPGTPELTGDKVFVFVLLLIYVAFLNQEGKVKPNWPLHVAMFSFVIIIFSRIASSAHPTWDGQAVLTSYLYPIVAYFLARRWITDKPKLSLLITVIITVCVYFAAFAFYEQYTGRLVFGSVLLSDHMKESYGAIRVQGPAESSSEFGMILVVGAMLAIIRGARDKRPVYRALYAVIALAAIISCGLTLRRTVYLVVVVSLIIMLFASKATRRRALVYLCLIFVSIAGFWGTISDSQVFKTRLSQKSFIPRKIMFATASDIFRDHYLFGIGPGNIPDVSRNYLRGLGDAQPILGVDTIASPHNSYLRIATEGGLAAFIPFLVMMTLIITTARRCYKNTSGCGPSERDAFYVFGAFTLGLLVMAMEEDVFYYSHYLMTVWFFFFGALSRVYMEAGKTAIQPVAEKARMGLRRYRENY